MLEHCIKATTFEGDVVLDCFAGSGSTGVAALRLNRRSISIEIDKNWCESIAQRMESIKAISQDVSIPISIIMKGTGKKQETQTLFDFAYVPC